jgi:hypothetical protein
VLNTFPELVRKWVGKRSLAEAAADVPASASTVHYWLTGIALPPSTRIAGIARAMGVSERRLRAVVDAERAARKKGATHV